VRCGVPLRKRWTSPSSAVARTGDSREKRLLRAYPFGDVIFLA
jgi:hypothetical protein